MIDEKNILSRVLTMEVMAGNLLKEAAVLRQSLQAAQQPASARKGRGVNPDIAKAAIARYEKKKAKQLIKIK